MRYRIERIDLFVRETPPARMVLALGKEATSGAPPGRIRNAVGYVRLSLRDSRGRTAFGCAAEE